MVVWTEARHTLLDAEDPVTTITPDPPSLDRFNGLDFAHECVAATFSNGAERRAALQAQNHATQLMRSRQTFRQRTIVPNHERPQALWDRHTPEVPKGPEDSARQAKKRSKPKPTPRDLHFKVSSAGNMRRPLSESDSEDEDAATQLNVPLDDTPEVNDLAAAGKHKFPMASHVRTLRGALRSLSADQYCHSTRTMADLIRMTVMRQRLELLTFQKAMALDLHARLEVGGRRPGFNPWHTQDGVFKLACAIVHMLRESPHDRVYVPPAEFRFQDPMNRSNAIERILEGMRANNYSYLLPARRWDILTDATILRAFRDNGELIANVDFDSMSAVQSVLDPGPYSDVDPLPPLCHIPGYDAHWQTIAKQYAANFVTGTKESTARVLKRWARHHIGLVPELEGQSKAARSRLNTVLYNELVTTAIRHPSLQHDPIDLSVTTKDALSEALRLSPDDEPTALEATKRLLEGLLSVRDSKLDCMYVQSLSPSAFITGKTIRFDLDEDEWQIKLSPLMLVRWQHFCLRELGQTYGASLVRVSRGPVPISLANLYV